MVHSTSERQNRMMLSENPDVEEFSEWVQAQSSDLSENVGEHFSENVGEHFSEADLIQKLLSLEPDERKEEPDLLQRLLLLEEGHHEDLEGHHEDTHKNHFSEADLVQELMVLEQEGERDVKEDRLLSDVELFQDLHAIDHKAVVDQDIKDDIMTEDEDEDDEDDKKENEEDDQSRHISTTIYKSRLEEVGLGGLEPMYVIKCTTNEFRDMTLSGRMLPEQTAACKEVRKKGRNKQHATNCRSRKESEVKLLQAKLQKAKKKLKKTKVMHNQLMTESGLMEWEKEEAKYRYQQMTSWKINWAQIETPFCQ